MNWLRFEIGLLLGVVIGIVLTMFVLSAFLFDILAGLVAAGTLFLGAASFYQTSTANAEKKARQLAEVVYIPLREDVSTWLEPIVPTQTIQMISATSEAWPSLRRGGLYWIPKVPKELVEKLDEALAKFDDLPSLSYELVEATRTSTRRLVQESTGKVSLPEGVLQFRMVGERGLSETISLPKVYLSGLTLRDFLDAIFRTHLGEERYKLELVDATNKLVCAGEDAETVAEGVLKFLASQRGAREMKQRLEGIRQLGAQALSIIDRKLDLG